MKFQLHELVVATHSPFHQDGSVNLDIIELQAAHFLKTGINAVFICGSTGESHSLNIEERKAITTRWCKVTQGTTIKVIAHVGSNCLVDSQQLAQHARQAGVVAISALAPGYYKPENVEQLVDYCRELTKSTPELPFYFYDIPSMTNVNLSMPQFLEMSLEKLPSLRGLKFTNQNLISFQQCLNFNQGYFDIPWGIDECLLPALALGAKGAVGSSYNFAAKLYLEIIKAFEAGKMEEARKLQFKSVQLILTLGKYGYLPAAKYLMSLLGMNVGPTRLPIRNLTETQMRSLKSNLELLGYFDWIK